MSLRENLAEENLFNFDRFNQSIIIDRLIESVKVDGIRPRERGFWTSMKGRNSTFVNCLKIKGVGSMGGKMGKVFDEACKSWWPFKLHSEGLDMLGLY